MYSSPPISPILSLIPPFPPHFCSEILLEELRVGFTPLLLPTPSLIV